MLYARAFAFFRIASALTKCESPVRSSREFDSVLITGMTMSISSKPFILRNNFGSLIEIFTHCDRPRKQCRRYLGAGRVLYSRGHRVHTARFAKIFRIKCFGFAFVKGRFNVIGCLRISRTAFQDFCPCRSESMGQNYLDRGR